MKELEDLKYWESIFAPLGCRVTGWTYRNHCQIRLPSGRYLSITQEILELVSVATTKEAGL